MRVLNKGNIAGYIESVVTFTYNLQQCESFYRKEFNMTTNKQNDPSLLTKSSKELIEVWEDVIDVHDLVLAIIITVTLTMTLYVLAPNQAPFPLIFGLVGALLGFSLSIFLIKPKRTVMLINSKGEK